MPTDIEWTHFPGTTGETWNPINATRLDSGKRGWHCEKVSPGCANCYAETFNGRSLPACGTGLDYTVPNRALVEIGIREDTLDKPMHWTKPRTIFANSMTDLFADFHTNEMIDRVFAVMALAHWHRYIVLTKRAKRMREYVSNPNLSQRIHELIKHLMGYDNPRRPAFNTADLPLPNLILGVSVENRDYLHRIDDLRATPAACRMISAEPLLENLGQIDLGGIGWLVAGGESGPGARPMHPDWARALREQCTAAGVSYFFKQFGTWAKCIWDDASVDHSACRRISANGLDVTGNMDHWADTDEVMRCVGKKKAGRLLDGREWSEFPKLAVCP